MKPLTEGKCRSNMKDFDSTKHPIVPPPPPRPKGEIPKVLEEAAAVDDAMIERACMAFDHWCGDGRSVRGAPVQAMRAALIAALAPVPASHGKGEASYGVPAVERGEAVAWMNSSGSTMKPAARERMIADAIHGGEFAAAARVAERHNIPLYAGRGAKDE